MTDHPAELEARAPLASLRMPFIANQGQVDARVAYYAPTFAGTLFVTRRGQIVYNLPARAATTARERRSAGPAPGWSLTETLVEGRPRPEAGERGAAGVSDFRGADRARWRAQVPTYERITLGEVWPGIALALHARAQGVEKVFTVAPGAPLERIRVRVSGARGLSVNPAGALVVRTDLGDVTFTAPLASQQRDGARHPVALTYRVDGDVYGFAAEAYDRTRPLVIDPLLQSTYLGGAGSLSEAYAIAVASGTGDVYVAGGTDAAAFPGTAGGARAANGGGFDVFVARLNSALTSLVQATYLGGGDFDTAYTLAIAPGTGDVYVAGDTRSTDFSGTLGGAQAAYAGGLSDTFVARLSSGLTALAQATYVGGSNRDEAYGIAVAGGGDVFLTGYTQSTDFPGTGGGAQPVYGGGATDGFVVRLHASLTTLVKATYLGGDSTDHANAIAIAPGSGDVYVAGDTTSVNFPATGGGAQAANAGFADAFVARLPDTLTAMSGATYVGGSDDDVATALAIAPGSGDVYVAGYTLSLNLPGVTGAAQSTSGGGFDAFVARLNASLTALTRATYLGDTGDDYGLALAIHPATGEVYAAGATTSTGFPHTSGGARPLFAGGLYDAFVTRLTGDLATLAQSTYLGGGGDDVAFAIAIHPPSGDVYAAGLTRSADFPATAGGAQGALGGIEDAVVARLTRSLAANSTFVDVPESHPLFAWIEALARSGITSGCVPSPPQFCPNGVVTRAQMAVFLLKGIHGAAYDPPAATGTMFADVPNTLGLAKWIERLAVEGITSGCGGSPPRYCPDDAVTRAQMAVFLLRAKHGSAYDPPDPTGTMFGDVPTTLGLAEWIERLAVEGITSGCSSSPPLYCPGASVTRGAMAVFLVRIFNLPL